jgi:hypothetical protein
MSEADVFFFYKIVHVFTINDCRQSEHEMQSKIAIVEAAFSNKKFFPLLPMPPHVNVDFVVSPPGCGRSVTDFWGWGAHRAQLRCPDDVSDDMYERGVPGGALNLNSTGSPDHGRYGNLPLQGKIPTAEPGIEPGTSWPVVRSSDHQATRLVIRKLLSPRNWTWIEGRK